MAQPLSLTLSGLLFLSFLLPDSKAQPVLNQKVLKKALVFNEEAINSPGMESSPCFAGDKIVYVFTGPKGKIWDAQTGDAYFDLGFATVHADNTLSEKGFYNKDVNSTWHEGPAYYLSNENTLYFTRTWKEKRVIGVGTSDTFYLRIMKADLNEAKPVIKPLFAEEGKYSICHPTLNLKGNTMVFASNRPGGVGKMDLFAAYSSGEDWSGIISLGHDMNSPFNEVFPSLVNDSLLFFTSDRPGGPGGLDIYVSRLKYGVWTAPEILPPPFNSPYDDLGMIVRPNGKSGYFASNRPGGLGKDDIYRWETKEPIFYASEKELNTVTLFALDKLSLEPVAGATVQVRPLTTDLNQFTLSEYNLQLLEGSAEGDLILRISPQKLKEIDTQTTDDEGKSHFSVPAHRQYYLQVQKEGFTIASLLYDSQVLGDTIHLLLEPAGVPEDSVTIEEEEPEVDNEETERIPFSEGNTLVLDNIYYDYNSSSIMPGAATELDSLANWLVAHPLSRIRLVAHTDSRGSADYNMQLSVNRAVAAKNYLKNAGVDESRIDIRGMGEKSLRNHCKNGIPCTDKQHRFNRRTEVVLLNGEIENE